MTVRILKGKKAKAARAGFGPTIIVGTVPGMSPSLGQLRDALKSANLYVAPDMLGAPTVWCVECGRDSGFHWAKCSKEKQLVGDIRELIEAAESTPHKIKNQLAGAIRHARVRIGEVKP